MSMPNEEVPVPIGLERSLIPGPSPMSSNTRARPSESVPILALRSGKAIPCFDEVVGEEPLEIRMSTLGHAPVPIAVTMRTPGHDFELAVGFLLSEGLLERQVEVRSVRYCTLEPGAIQRYNIVTVDTSSSKTVESRREGLTVTSSCGICGTATLEQLDRRCSPLSSETQIAKDDLIDLPQRLRESQRIFTQTGGLHAAGLFDTGTKVLNAVREDVERHNAVDKLIGWAALQHQLPLSETALIVSGRVSFEIVQKAAIAGIPILAAVSAPSSLAVVTARDLRMMLAGFVRDGRANIYTCPERLVERLPAPGGTESKSHESATIVRAQ